MDQVDLIRHQGMTLKGERNWSVRDKFEEFHDSSKPEDSQDFYDANDPILAVGFRTVAAPHNAVLPTSKLSRI